MPNTFKDSNFSTSKGKGQALMESSSSLAKCILDSSASHHMGSSKQNYFSLEKSKVPQTFVERDTQVTDEGKGQVEMENEEFKYVLYVPHLSNNILSIYQITHCGGGKKDKVLLDLVMVLNLKDDSLVAVGKVNHDTSFYSFSHFVPKSP